MPKNGLKIAQASHMINNNIFKFLVFELFLFGYITNPEFWPNIKKIALKTRCRKY